MRNLPIRPQRSLYYPTMNPPSTRGYKVEVFNNLMNDNIMVYEVMRPYDVHPWTFLVYNFEDHLQFFHHIWHMDEFSGTAADRHFLMRLWHHLCAAHGPYAPAALDLSIEEEDEPVEYRFNARGIIMRYLQDTLDLFEEVQDVVVSDEEETNRIKEDIGRFCVFFIL